MRCHTASSFFHVSLGLAVTMAVTLVGASPSSLPAMTINEPSKRDCSRSCMTDIVTTLLDSMVAHDPYAVPMANGYKATENSHPAAIGMMSLWRTVTAAGEPSLLAIDTTNGTAYFALDISEGNDEVLNVLRGRIAVVDQQITELELFINRFRGDHGFSFSAAELPTNYAELMSPPSNRTKASRETLMELSTALFAESSNFTVDLADDCQFTELGWKVVDPGNNSTGSEDPIGCVWPDQHPVDDTARVGLVVDEELGFVVTSAMIQGTVFPYSNISAFIPNRMTDAQDAQWTWIEEMESLGIISLMTPFGASGDTMEVLQYYDDALQAMQINVYLSGPNMTSAWV